MANCEFAADCPYGQVCANTKLVDYGDEQLAEVLIVKSVPSKVCDTNNNLYGEQADRETLSPYLAQAGIMSDKSKVFLTSIIRCGIDKKNKELNSSKVYKKALEYCSQHMEHTMARLKNLKVVVTLGSEARDYFCQDKLTITKTAGRQYKKNYGHGEISVIPNLNQVAVFMSPERHENKFRSIFQKANRILKDEVKSAPFKKKYLTYTEFQEYTKRLLQYYKDGRIVDVAYDIESSTSYGDDNSLTSLAHSDEEYITGFSLADEIEETGYYINLYHPRLAEERGKGLSDSEFQLTWKLLKEVMETIPVYCHNAKFDLLWSFVKLKIDPAKVVLADDTFALAFLIFGAKRDTGQGLGLKELCKFLFQIDEDWDEAIEIELSKFNRIKDRRLTNIPFKVLSDYGAMDAIAMLFLRRKLKEMMTHPSNSKLHVPYKLLLRAIKVFSQVESNNVPVHAGVLNYLDSSYNQRVSESIRKLNKLPKTQAFFRELYFTENPDITPEDMEAKLEKSELKIRGNQIKDYIFGFLKCPVYSETDSGKPSLDKAARLKLAKEAPEEYQREAVSLLTDSVEVADQISKYINPIKNQIKSFGGFYPDYNLCSVTTGRLSGLLHTMPSFGDMKYNFISHWADEGGLVFAPDYSQVEVRAFASLSGDENLKLAYEEGLDIHKFVASKSFGMAYEDVSKLERGRAKGVIFGMLFGQSVWTLAENLGITEEEAQAIQDSVFLRFPKIKIFIDSVITFGEKNGYVESAVGRKRMLEALKKFKYTRDKMERKRYNAAVRAAQNHPIQSTASDVTLSSIVEMHDRIKASGMKSKFLGTVHDSIEISVHPSEIIKIIKMIKIVCEDDLPNRFDWLNGVPYRMDIEGGVSWGNCVDWEIEKYDDDGGGVFEISGRDMGVKSIMESFEKNKYFNAVMTNMEVTEDKPETDPKRVFNGIIYTSSTHKVKGILTLTRTDYDR